MISSKLQKNEISAGHLFALPADGLRRVFILWFLCVSMLTTFSGCGSRTVIGGYTDSADEKYRAYGRVFGAVGHAFVGYSDKTVRISIVQKNYEEPLLFRREYVVKGSDVGWEINWDNQSNISGVIFDYGRNVTFSGERKDEPPRRIIRTFAYHFDSKTGKFADRSDK